MNTIFWIARDIDDIVCLFISKPECSENGMWYVPFESGNNPQNIILGKNMFPEVTFNNSPQKVELKLIKE